MARTWKKGGRTLRKSVNNNFRKGRKYFTKIFVVMLCLLMGLLLPFSLLLQQRANQHIRQSIDDSNQLFLRQIKYDYELFRENIASLCLSTFYDQDMQEIMYSAERDYGDIYYNILRIKKTIVSVQPSVYSVEIYNAKLGEVFSTRTEQTDVKAELTEFFEQTSNVQKLTPILRKIKVGVNDDAYTWVFSYFMYDFQHPETMDSSFLVINQKAGWFVEALGQATNSIYDTSVFVVNTADMSTPYISTSNQAEAEMLWDCVENIKSKKIDAEFGNYVTRAKTGKYLVSYISMAGGDDILVMFQDYGQVFSSMIKMRNEFVILIIFCLFLGIGAVVLLSNRLYKPIEELFTYAKELDNSDQKEILAASGDELSQIQEILDHYKLKSQQLSNENGIQGVALKKLMLSSLLNGTGTSGWQNYKKILPDSPFSNQTKWNVFVAIVKVKEREDDGVYELTAEEEDLVFTGIYNIFLELMRGGIVERSKQNPWENVYVLNVPNHEIPNVGKYFEKLIALTAEKVNIPLIVSCSTMGSSMLELPELYKQARRHLQYHLLFSNECVLDSEKCAANETNTNVMYSSRTEKKLLEGIRSGNWEKVKESLGLLQEEIAQLRYEYVLANVIELVTKIKLCIGERNDMKTGQAFAKIYPQILTATTLADMFVVLSEGLSMMLQVEVDKDTYIENENQQFVEKIKAFIESNYSDENLSLQTVAAHMNMSARYVSKKFKQHTDLFINDYILSFRMQKAAELLLKTDASVEQIASQIGISSSNYFYRLFKNEFGCTPRDFVRHAKMVN